MTEEILQLTKQLIAIPSTEDNKDTLHEVLQVADEILKDFPSQQFESNGIPSRLYSNKPNAKKFHFILNGHLDVIPALPDQFIPYEKDGKLYGRGALDMKTATAAMILLFKEFAAKVSYPLALQLVTDEEAGGYNGTGYQVRQGVRGDFILTGEGSNFIIINQTKSRYTVKFTTQGKTAHSGYPWRGENAIVHMHHWLRTLLEAYPQATEETRETTASVTRIFTTNTVINKIPADCSAIVDFRLAPKGRKQLLDYLTQHVPVTVQSEVVLDLVSPDVDPANIYVQALQKIGKEITKKDIPLALAYGASDMPHYAKVGCDGIELGVIGGDHHAEKEWVNIKSIEPYYQVLKEFLFFMEKH